MSRADRIRKIVPGAPDDLIAALAARPAAEVDLIVTALRQARRDERQHQRALAKQRKTTVESGEVVPRRYEEAQLGGRNLRMLDAAGRRAQGDLDALEWLAQSRRHADRLIALAVAGLRAEGVPDAEIARRLGVTRGAVGLRFGRRGDSTPGAEASDGAA